MIETLLLILCFVSYYIGKTTGHYKAEAELAELKLKLFDLKVIKTDKAMKKLKAIVAKRGKNES